MIVSFLRWLKLILSLFIKHGPDRFLLDVSGVVHVGANTGQEALLYDRLGLDVIWIEPIPEVFEVLRARILRFPRQRAFQRLIADSDGARYSFHVSNNGGLSSSILDLKLHEEIWPEVGYSKTIELHSITLSSLFRAEAIDLSMYQALVMDTQGSEMLVLKGALPILTAFEYIKTEVADFESYVGCCRLAEMDAFMTEHGYAEHCRHRIQSHTGIGSYFDVIYKRLR